MAIREPKYCKDCTYFIPEDQSCYQAKRVDLVTGQTAYGYAMTQRHSASAHDCGVDAKYWAPLTVHPYTETTNGNEG